MLPRSVQSAETVEYADCISAEGVRRNFCPEYVSKPTDVESLVL